MHVLDEIRAKREEIYSIARKHNVEKIYVFGSCARREERPDSDIDFLVDFNDTASLLDHGRLYNTLGGLFGRSVDVVDRGAVKEGSIFATMLERDVVSI